MTIEAIQSFEPIFTGMAYNLLAARSLRDVMLIDDLVQEMRIKLIDMEPGQKRGYYTIAAKFAARQFLDKWLARGKLIPLSSFADYRIDALLETDSYRENWENTRCCGNPYFGVKRAHGEQVSTAKLNEEKVQQIWELAGDGMPIRAVAMKLDVSKSTIGDILTGKTWSHIKIDYKVKLKYLKRVGVYNG